jgi:hypothetical protein
MPDALEQFDDEQRSKMDVTGLQDKVDILQGILRLL